jgi:hypothetical protein
MEESIQNVQPHVRKHVKIDIKILNVNKNAHQVVFVQLVHTWTLVTIKHVLKLKSVHVLIVVIFTRVAKESLLNAMNVCAKEVNGLVQTKNVQEHVK